PGSSSRSHAGFRRLLRLFVGLLPGRARNDASAAPRRLPQSRTERPAGKCSGESSAPDKEGALLTSGRAGNRPTGFGAAMSERRRARDATNDAELEQILRTQAQAVGDRRGLTGIVFEDGGGTLGGDHREVGVGRDPQVGGGRQGQRPTRTALTDDQRGDGDARAGHGGEELGDRGADPAALSGGV